MPPWFFQSPFKILARGLAAWIAITMTATFAGGIAYPAGGNFDPEEGTLKIWVTPMAMDLDPPDDGGYHAILSFFNLVLPGEWRLYAKEYALMGEDHYRSYDYEARPLLQLWDTDQQRYRILKVSSEES